MSLPKELIHTVLKNTAEVSTADVIRTVAVIPVGGGGVRLRCQCGFTTRIYPTAFSRPQDPQPGPAYEDNPLQTMLEHWHVCR